MALFEEAVKPLGDGILQEEVITGAGFATPQPCPPRTNFSSVRWSVLTGLPDWSPASAARVSPPKWIVSF